MSFLYPKTNQPNIMNILRPLSPQVRRFLYAVLIIFTLLLLCYFLCLTLGSIALFQAFLCKMSFFLGGRTLSFALFKLGCSCSAGLALTVGFALQALLTGEGFTNMMAPAGDSGDPGSIIYRAPSPGGPVEILEIPESPPAPLSVEEEEQLLTKREEVKFLIRVLLQIGYNKRARNEKEIKQLFQDIDIDSERNATFLEELHDHLRGLRRPGGHGGTSGQPKKFSNIEVQELLRWISEKRGN